MRNRIVKDCPKDYKGVMKDQNFVQREGQLAFGPAQKVLP